MGRFTFVQTKNVLIVGEKILKYPITVAHNAIKMVIIEGKMVVLSNVNSVRLLKKFPIKRTKTKMTKHEERRLMKKYSQPDEPEESALAQALKAAMNQE